MRKAGLASAVVLLAVVLGATVLQAPVASAVNKFSDVVVRNTAENPVPVVQQGTANVAVQGTVPVKVIEPANQFSVVLSDEDGSQAIDGCGAGLPATTAWHISSISGTAFVGSNPGYSTVQLGLRDPSGGQLFAGYPTMRVPEKGSLQFTFPQPLVINSRAAGDCLVALLEEGSDLIVVGYRTT